MANKFQPILPSMVRRAEYGRTVYAATLAEGVTVSDLTKSDFWVHLAPTLEALDHVEAITADGETYVELIVSRVEKINEGTRTLRIPKLAVLHEVHLTKAKAASAAKTATAADVADADATDRDNALRNQSENRAPNTDAPGIDDEDGDGVPDGYQVKFGGPTHKFRVLKDGVTEPLASGMNKADAIAWAVDYAAKSAA